MNSFNEQAMDDEQDELQRLWDDLPATSMEPEVANSLPNLAVLRVERAERRSRNWRFAGTGLAAALVLLVSRITLDSDPAESDRGERPPTAVTESQVAKEGVRPASPLSTDPPVRLIHNDADLLASLRNSPSTHTLSAIRRALGHALDADDTQRTAKLADGLLAIEFSSLSRSAQQTWRSGLARLLVAPAFEKVDGSEEREWPLALADQLRKMPPAVLESFTRSDLEPEKLSAQAASLVGEALASSLATERLFALGMQYSGFEDSALAALNSEAGQSLLDAKLRHAPSRSSQFLLRAVAETQPLRGLEYAKRFVPRKSVRADALMAIAAYPAEDSFAELLQQEARYGSDSLREALGALLYREVDRVAALPLPASVRRQEEAVDALFTHESAEAQFVLLTWAIRAPSEGAALQRSERERLLLAASEWTAADQADLLYAAFPKLYTEGDSLAAAALLSASRIDSADSAIDRTMRNTSMLSRDTRELKAILTQRRGPRSSDATLLLRLRRWLRESPTIRTPPLTDRNDPIDSIHLPSEQVS